MKAAVIGFAIGGIRRVLPIKLSDVEAKKFRASAAAVRAMIESIQNIRN